MLKLIITVTMFMTALLCRAQVSEIRNVDDFSKIEVAAGIELHYIETKEAPSVRVEGKNGNLADIFTEVENGTLKIFANKQQEMKVYVASRSIEAFKAVSKSSIFVDNTMHSENISIELQSGAYFRGYIKSNQSVQVATTGSDTEFNARIEASSFVGNFKKHSKVNISGKAKNVFLTSSSKSYCNARNFITENTKIDSENATVVITSKNTINVNATDNAIVTYCGSPRKVTMEDQSVAQKKYIHPSLIAME